MIENYKKVERFEIEFIKTNKSNFKKNLRILNGLYKEAKKLKAFNKKFYSNEVEIKIAKILNSV